MGLVVSLCRFASPALAQEGTVAPQALSLSLKPTSSHLSLRLRAEGGSTHEYACDGPCVLDVKPGHYQLGVIDGQGETDWHQVDLSESETIEVHRSSNGLAIAGTALFATGAALAVLGSAAFLYGAVNNLEASGCQTPCGAVSGRFLRLSLAGAGVGVVLAAVGGVIVYNTRGPVVVEKPGASPELTAAKTGSLSFVLVPDLQTPRLPLALMNLTF
jgi:hypothetical protein